MNRRQLLGAAAVLLALASAAWYAVGAPSRGREVEPGGAAQVALTVSATGTGNWVRYLLTVKNVADGDFAGDVLLIDAQDMTQGNGAAPPALSNLNGRNLPRPPEVPAQSAYRVHVSVPSRKSRTITVIAPDSFNYAQVLSGGQVVQDAQVERAPALPVAVLSDLETAADAIGKLRFDRIAPRVATFGSARVFPATPLQLAGYSAVVIDQFDTAALSAAQVRALRDFVGFGGTLVLTGGSGWRRTVTPLQPDLVPIVPAATATVSLSPLAHLAGVNTGDLQALAATGTLNRAAHVLVATDDGVPLSAELEYGTGRVVQLAFDPAASPIAGSAFAGLSWGQAIGRSLASLPGNVPTAATLLAPDPQFTALLPPADDAPLPPPGVVAVVLLLYVLAAGPLNYLLLRRRLKRPALMWVTAPLVAIIFTASFYAVGTNLQGGLQDHEIQVMKVGPDQAVDLLGYHRILFLERGNHEIVGPLNALAAPLTLDTYRTTGSTCERCTNQLRGLPAGAEHVIPGHQPVVQERGVVYGSVRVVATAATTHRPAGVDAHLSFRGGRIQGTVVNISGQPIRHLTLFLGTAENLRFAEVAPALAPGATLDIDAAVRPEPTPQPPGSAWNVLRSIAAGVVAREGQPVLVGATTPIASGLRVDGKEPDGVSVAVLAQPLRLEGADASLREFQKKRLASSSGDASNGFLDVYDVLLPPTTSPLQLTFNRQFGTSVEVYDFARRAFVMVNGDPGDPVFTTPLSADQVQAGLVRVRVREARILQGAGISVDVAGAG